MNIITKKTEEIDISGLIDEQTLLIASLVYFKRPCIPVPPCLIESSMASAAFSAFTNSPAKGIF